MPGSGIKPFRGEKECLTARIMHNPLNTHGLFISEIAVLKKGFAELQVPIRQGGGVRSRRFAGIGILNAN